MTFTDKLKVCVLWDCVVDHKIHNRSNKTVTVVSAKCSLSSVIRSKPVVSCTIFINLFSTCAARNFIKLWSGQSPTWGRPSPQVRVESQCSYSKFLSQQWQLASNSKNCIAFYRRITWHMDLRQLTVYEHFRWVNAITFLFVGQSSSRVWLWGYPH